MVAETQNASTDVTETVIKYHQGDRARPSCCWPRCPGRSWNGPGTSPRLTLVLGSDYGTTSESTESVVPTPSPSISSRTASQNICAS